VLVDVLDFSDVELLLVDDSDFSDLAFLDELEDELPPDSVSFGRLSVMYQPEPLNTTPTG
jgi:hypothetical protein